MPRLTKAEFDLRLYQERQDGIARGRQIGREDVEKELRYERAQNLANILREGAALAQANAKLTYSLQLLVEKAAK